MVGGRWWSDGWGEEDGDCWGGNGGEWENGRMGEWAGSPINEAFDGDVDVRVN